MQALLSYPAYALYAIIAILTAAGILILRHEIRQDLKAEPDYQPRHQVTATLGLDPAEPLGAFTDSELMACPPAGVHCYQCGADRGCNLESAAELAAGNREPDPPAGWPYTDPMPFEQWEADQDAWREGAQRAARAVWDALDSGAWADAWWTRSGRLS